MRCFHRISARHVSFVVSQLVASHRCMENQSGSAAHSAPMWCCKRRFKTLHDLREHLFYQGTFGRTRAVLKQLLADALTGNEAAQQELFSDETKRLQMQLVLAEDAFAMELMRGFVPLTGPPGRTPRRRSRSVRRDLDAAPWRRRSPARESRG